MRLFFFQSIEIPLTMHSKLFLFSFFFIVLSSQQLFSQTLSKVITYYDDSTQFMKKEVFFIKDGDTSQIEGTFKKYYENGDLLAEGIFTEGKEEGIFEMYYPDGKLMRTTAYDAGKRDGKTIVFDIDGDTLQQASFRKDTLEGKLSLYYPDGQLKSESSFLNGKPEGKVKIG
ncbi:MAG: antitoxin component YwqK of YwqJK toxin-antitoxin module, partial [Marivirga sp.]